MDICDEHNLIEAADTDLPFGIRVRLAPTDPFRNLVGDEWETYHWFTSKRERDEAIVEMARRHEYSRLGDEPTLIYEPVER